MKKNILLILVITWLSGCSQAPIARDGSALDDCRRPFPWFCRGNSGSPVVTLNTKSKKLSVSPYCIKADKNSQIHFEIKPPGSNATNTVHIIPKDTADDPWLKKSNSGANPDVITVTIPPDINRDRRIYYGVKTDDACVDPRIRVEN